MTEHSKHAEAHIDSIVRQEEEALEKGHILNGSPIGLERSQGVLPSLHFTWCL